MRKQGKSLKIALETIGMSKSSYCYRPKTKRMPRALDPVLVQAIQEARRGHAEVYGYRKITAALKAQEFLFNSKKVLRHLQALKLTQPRKIKGQKWTRPAVVKPTTPNAYWEMDFTYVWMGSGNAYLCPVIDAFDRDIPGDVFSDRCRSQEACQALEQAVMKRFKARVPKGHKLTLRVDRGPQFIAKRFKEAAKTLNVRLEYAGIQCPEDKPYIESFNGKYKTEEVYRKEYSNLAQARAGWESYRAWYTNERLHQNLGYKSPKAFYEQAQICSRTNPRTSKHVKSRNQENHKLCIA